jgi:hypothetical protein
VIIVCHLTTKFEELTYVALQKYETFCVVLWFIIPLSLVGRWVSTFLEKHTPPPHEAGGNMVP